MILRYFIIISILFGLPVLAQAKVSAHVDRTTIEEGETFSLMLQSDGEDPQLDKLEQVFDVVGTSRSSKVSIVNGSVNRVNEWIINLAPKKSGVQVIPPITFGKETTAPIQVNVIKPVASNAAQGADVFVEAKVDQPSLYVQSQLIYSVRLYRAVEIREGSLTEPAFDNAVVERLGEDVTFQTQRSQRRYHVTERRYAIFPQQSGTLEFPETVFQGLVVDPQSQQFSSDPFNRFFQTQRTKRVRIKSNTLSVNVMPQPDEFKGEHWLPSKRLVLSESWSPENPQFKVGEPITRTLRMEALGLIGSQLPELKLFSAHGIKHYADQPTVETKQQGDDLLAVREEKFAIIPTSSGKLVLPEIRLSWWDTEYNTEKTISIPPKVIEVAPAATPAAQDPVVTTPVDAPDEPVSASESTKTIIKTVNDPGFWPYATAVVGLAWLVTLMMLVLISRRTPRHPVNSNTQLKANPVSTNKVMSELKQACLSNNPAVAKQAILDWAKLVWPDNPPRNIQQTAAHMEDSTIKQAFADLADLLYKEGSTDWNGAKFWDDVGKRMKQPKQSQIKTHTSLPDLYPQNS